MMKQAFYAVLLCIAFSMANAQAASTNTMADPYSQCVDDTIAELKLAGMNNGVVGACSNQAQAIYTKQIVKLLDQIKKQSKEYQQPERYHDIMKSQQLWKSFVDQECQNAGAYIGSPMYEYCPMQKYAERVEQLKEYVP